MVAAELRGVRKAYGRVEALRGVDLAIHEHEVVALLGPNGAGKTTAISLMLGLRQPTAGTAKIFGLDPRDRRARSRCGVVLQESGLPMALTVHEIVDLFRSCYPRPLTAAAALAYSGLEHRVQARVATLSGGERQRLYFALAVCGDPEVLFLDEPTVGMDVEARQRFLASLERFAAAGKTIVLTTHYLAEADLVARRVVVIDHGVIVADAAPDAIKARVPGRRVSFRTAGTLDGKALDGLPVEHVGVQGDRVSLLTSDAEAVLRALFGRGVVIGELEVAGATLEEALLALTRRPRDDGAR
jgi:ABC-2 type transport system ATP-binding protein